MKRMIKYILTIIIISSVNYSSAQRYKIPQNLARYDSKKLHFGFSLGLNSLDFHIKKDAETLYNDTLYVLESQNQYGFNLGIVTNLRLSKYTDLRFIPALVFAERHLEYSFKDVSSNITFNKIKKIESTLIDFPIYVKYKSERYNNFRAYVIGGLKYSIDIASQDDIDDIENQIVKLKKHDFMGEIGFGMDFYLEYFKFSPQIKLAYGLINILSKDATVYTKSIRRLTTNGWVLSFTFE
ncbi:MAG: porin family protein [Bacteroidota bacterium]|nr:porin family protein [Bacteroidota bacterium]